MSIAAADFERTGGPYVPTPQIVVDAMLGLAKVGPADFVVDLGSGDGRIVLTAAQRYGASGLGIDIDPELVEQSNAQAARLGLSDKVTFREQDVLQAQIAEASVLTLYLLPGMMQTLKTKLMRELKAGTRIVSHDFSFQDWKPDQEVSIDIPEKYGTPGRRKSTLFYWIVPARVEGSWRVAVPGLSGQPFNLTLAQDHQTLAGTLIARGRRVGLSNGKVEAMRVRFSVPLEGGTCEFKGVLEGESLRGEATQAGRTFGWTASRAEGVSAAK